MWVHTGEPSRGCPRRSGDLAPLSSVSSATGPSGAQAWIRHFASCCMPGAQMLHCNLQCSVQGADNTSMLLVLSLMPELTGVESSCLWLHLPQATQGGKIRVHAQNPVKGLVLVAKVNDAMPLHKFWHALPCFNCLALVMGTCNINHLLDGHRQLHRCNMQWRTFVNSMQRALVAHAAVPGLL